RPRSRWPEVVIRITRAHPIGRWRLAGLALLALVLVLAGSGGAGAEDLLGAGFELRGGVLAHDVPGLWSGFRLERGVDINGEILFGNGLQSWVARCARRSAARSTSTVLPARPMPTCAGKPSCRRTCSLGWA